MAKVEIGPRPPSFVTRAELAWELSMEEADVTALVASGVLPPALPMRRGQKEARWSWAAVDAAMLRAERKPWGFIYLAGFGDYVKIGFSAESVELRIASLQTGCPEKLTVYATVEGTIDDERKLHKRFAEHRLRGEWFRLTDEIKAYIAEVAGK